MNEKGYTKHVREYLCSNTHSDRGTQGRGANGAEAGRRRTKRVATVGKPTVASQPSLKPWRPNLSNGCNSPANGRPILSCNRTLKTSGAHFLCDNCGSLHAMFESNMNTVVKNAMNSQLYIHPLIIFEVSTRLRGTYGKPNIK